MVQKLPPQFFEDEEDFKPAAFKTLFPPSATSDDLSKITETPTRMVIPLVRMAMIDAASDPKRKESLISIFTRCFDTRMISRDRKGRIEAVALMQARSRMEEEETEVPL